MPMLDFQQIKQDHPILPVCERLGIKLKKEGQSYRGACPSGEDGDRKLVITPSKSAWYSFAAQKGGDVISLVAFVNGCSLKEAAAWIVGAQPEKKKADNSPKPPMAEKPSEGFRPLDYLVSDHEAVIAIGFDPVDATRIGAGYCPRGILRGTVAVPVRDSNGKLIGYIGCRDVTLPSQWHH